VLNDFLEAYVSLFPRDAGGRGGVIAPRDGSYRPFARIVDGPEPMLRIRFIEGPPRLLAGDGARVVVELETPASLRAGAELELVEHAGRVVGVMTVLRLWRGDIAV
jgi:hypothetical protein